MQNLITQEQLWEKLTLLSGWQQQLILRLINSLLEAQPTAGERDKRRLLSLSVWNAKDIQRIEEAQAKVNEWRIPQF